MLQYFNNLFAVHGFYSVHIGLTHEETVSAIPTMAFVFYVVNIYVPETLSTTAITVNVSTPSQAYIISVSFRNGLSGVIHVTFKLSFNIYKK